MGGKDNTFTKKDAHKKVVLDLTLAKQVVPPGMWFPSYLMSISCRPLSVGWYLMVMVPSLLSVMCGRAVFPDGIRTSPAKRQFGFRIKQSRQGLTKGEKCFLEDRCTCDLSLLRHEGHQEVDGAKERVHSIAGHNWLVGGLSITGREVF